MLYDIEHRSNPDETTDQAEKDNRTESQEEVRESLFQSDSKTKSPIRSSLSKSLAPIGEIVEESAEFSADEFVPTDFVWMGGEKQDENI